MQINTSKYLDIRFQTYIHLFIYLHTPFLPIHIIIKIAITSIIVYDLIIIIYIFGPTVWVKRLLDNLIIVEYSSSDHILFQANQVLLTGDCSLLELTEPPWPAFCTNSCKFYTLFKPAPAADVLILFMLPLPHLGLIQKI